MKEEFKMNILCYANSNDAMVPEVWAQESLALLEENMVEITTR